MVVPPLTQQQNAEFPQISPTTSPTFFPFYIWSLCFSLRVLQVVGSPCPRTFSSLSNCVVMGDSNRWVNLPAFPLCDGIRFSLHFAPFPFPPLTSPLPLARQPAASLFPHLIPPSGTSKWPSTFSFFPFTRSSPLPLKRPLVILFSSQIPVKHRFFATGPQPRVLPLHPSPPSGRTAPRLHGEVQPI